MANDSIGTRLVSGDEEAWTFVLKKVVPQARAAIHRKFGPMWRSMDDEEMVNSAYRTIFRRLKEDSLTNGLISWDDFERLLVVVASRKVIDAFRKTVAEKQRETQRVQADRRKSVIGFAKESAVLEEIYQAECDRAIDKLMASLFDDLEDHTERIIFQGKLNGFTEDKIAERVEAEMGGRMTVFMVKNHWRKIRARFNRLHSELPDGLSE